MVVIQVDRMVFKIVIMILMMTPATALPNRLKSRTPPRWLEPCGPASGVARQRVDIPKRLREFASRMDELQRATRNLMTKYIELRFKFSESEADQLLPIEGCSEGLPPAEFEVTYERAFENLARLAVFVNKSHEGEEQTETNSFADDYLKLEFNNGRGGIYDSLCLLQALIIGTGEQLSEDMITRVSAITVCTVPNNAQRHQRDYIILRHLASLTNLLAESFRLLAEGTWAN